MIRNAAEVCGSRSTVPETIPPPPLPLHFVPSFSFSSFGGFFFPSPPLSLSPIKHASSLSFFTSFSSPFSFHTRAARPRHELPSSSQDRSALHHLLILHLVFSSLVYIYIRIYIVYTFCTILVFIFLRWFIFLSHRNRDISTAFQASTVKLPRKDDNYLARKIILTYCARAISSVADATFSRARARAYDT